MTELEKCMESLIVIFHRYADEDGDGKTLTKKELKKLMETELPAFLKVRCFCFFSNLIPILSTSQCICATYFSLFQAQKNPKAVDSILKDLDQNKDDKLNFEEFLSLVVGLSMACEKCYVLHEQKKAKKWWANVRKNNDVDFLEQDKFCSTNVCQIHK